MTTEAEIRWHDELDAVLAEPLGGEPGTSYPGGAGIITRGNSTYGDHRGQGPRA